jgi:glycosyltransferase involved in cell wall biosynthesis
VPPSRDKPLRILTVTHNYPRFAGDPAGAFVARIAEGAAARGHEVEVIAPHAPGTAVAEHVGGVRLHRFRYAPERLERVAYAGGLPQDLHRSPLTLLALSGFLLAFERTLRQVIRRLSPDLIHAHWWFPAGWFVSRRGRPYLLTCHGSDVRLLERSGILLRTALPVFSRASRVTAVSLFLARDIGRWIPGVAGSILVTQMPVDTDRFVAGAARPKAMPPRILYAGNLVPSKGVDVLLHAAAELSRRGVDHEVRIVGEGPSARDLRSLADRLGLESRVSWSSFLPQAAMPAEYGASTVTVLPSRGNAEGLGLTLVEALLAGSAVVGTPAGGIPEVVRHEETGLLARDGNATDLADQIQRLLTDGALRERLSRVGKEFVLRTYSSPAAVARFLDLYHAIADNQPHH